MADGTKQINDTLNRTLNMELPNNPGKSKSFIVDSNTPLPEGVYGYCIEVLEDVTLDTISDELLVSGSGDYPTDWIAGFRTYGRFTGITVSSGIIKVYLV